MFSLGGGNCANESTQGGRVNGNTGATMVPRKNLGNSMSNEWDNTRAPLRGDLSAPNVGSRFGEPGEHGDLARTENAFAIGTGGEPNNIAVSTPPIKITQ